MDVASSLEFADAEKALSELKGTFNKAKTFLEQVNALENDSSLEVFHQVIPPFMEHAAGVIDELEQTRKATEDSFLELLKFFGLPEGKVKTTSPPAFFGPIKEFVHSFLQQLAQVQRSDPSNAPGRKAMGRGFVPFIDSHKTTWPTNWRWRRSFGSPRERDSFGRSGNDEERKQQDSKYQHRIKSGICGCVDLLSHSGREAVLLWERYFPGS